MRSLIEEIKMAQENIIEDKDIPADRKVLAVVMLEEQIRKLIRADISANRTKWRILDELEELKKLES